MSRFYYSILSPNLIFAAIIRYYETMEMIKISIIIPLYNDECRIGRSLTSICNQSIRNQIEIIIIADGCTDHSVEIAQGILITVGSGIPSRVIVLSQNKGVANARKVGIVEATGVFVLFCDSDDWMDPRMCEKMLEVADEKGSDIVVCDYFKVKGDNMEYVGPCFKEDFLRELLLCNVPGSLWNKLIRRSIMSRPDFYFPEHDFSEDYAYCLQSVIYAGTISYVPEPLYYYLHRPDSIVRSNSAEKRMKRYVDDMANFTLDIKVLNANGIEDVYRDEIIAHKLKMKNTYKDDKQLWKSTFPELKYNVFKSACIPFRSKVRFYIDLLRAFV